MMPKESLIELLKNTSADWQFSSKIEEPIEVLGHEFSLYHIKQVTFDEDSPRKEAFENVLNALAIEGIIFTYILLGNKDQVHFYFGLAKNKQFKGCTALEVDDIGEIILKPSLEGNFRGSRVDKLDKAQRKDVKELISEFSQIYKLEGVPNIHEDNEEFQGIDRLVDIMSGDEFCLIVMADPLSQSEINKIENELYQIYDKLNPFAKTSIQSGENLSSSKGEAEGKTVTDSTGKNDNLSINKNTGKSVSVTTGTSENGGNKQTQKSVAETDHTKHINGSESKSEGTSVTKSIAINTGTNTSTQSGSSTSETREFTDKTVQEWLSYIDDVLLKRVQLGKNKGLYRSSIYLLANTPASVRKLGNTARSIFSGDEKNKSPLLIRQVTQSNEISSLRNFQLPVFKSVENNTNPISINENQLALLLSKSPFNRYACNWLSTKELSVIAGLPQKEVIGLTLKEEIEFGLNINAQVDVQERLYLGNLVKSGIAQSIEVFLDRQELDKHIFIAGVTGSGKTTTCQRLLESAQMPFLVIEPAKTEYRVLTKKNSNILIFTLGNNNVAPFRLNPFEFFPHENITSRVDMIKASIEASFDMEAAIPQLIEAAIYRCYEEKGWNIASSRNRLHTDPFADGVYAFPILSDLIRMTEIVVDEQGFDERLKQDYIGSIKARLQSLLIGAKGLMLDTPRSINFLDLVERNVILELEDIRNPSEKSLIMGFVLANLNEAIRACHKLYKQRGEKFRHITLIEEAHRLLAKFEAGDSPNKKQGVETFSDMLAEVRKYGESLIVVDQIPNKLTPEVLKNTNTKIIHKLFAQDDKDAVGNTMALSDEQKDFLSSLEPGRVVLSSAGINKPLQVQIKELVSTTIGQDVEPEEIRSIALQYYAEVYSTGLIQGLEHLENQPSPEDISDFLNDTVAESWYLAVGKPRDRANLLAYVQKFGWKFMFRYISTACYNNSSLEDKTSREELIEKFLCSLSVNEQERIDIYSNDAFLKDLKEKF